MLTSRLRLSQVALECGMCDQAHLSRAFRRIVGINPNAWRRQFVMDPAPDSFVAGKSRSGQRDEPGYSTAIRIQFQAQTIKTSSKACHTT